MNLPFYYKIYFLWNVNKKQAKIKPLIATIEQSPWAVFLLFSKASPVSFCRSSDLKVPKEFFSEPLNNVLNEDFKFIEYTLILQFLFQYF